MTACAMGIDVGATKIAAGLVSFPEAKILASEVRPTLARRGASAVLDDVYELAGALKLKGSVLAVGLGICELVDREGNIVSDNCVAWTSDDLRKRFSDIAPLIVEADVRAAAYGEAHFGAGKSFKHFLYVAVGTGISSCLVIHGKPYLGARGLTGTFASSPMPGLKHSLEQLASGAALGPTPEPAVLASAAEALGAGIGLLVNTLDPEAVIVGGGLGLSGGTYWERLVSSTRRHIWSPVHRELPVLPAVHPQAAVIGAAALALDKTAKR